MIDLRGKHALVTGGSRGIGAATALLLARAGAAVTVAYRDNHEAAGSVVEQITAAGGRAVAVDGDLRERGAADSIVRRAREQLGPVDVLVFNSGIWKRAPVDEMTGEQLRETLETNLHAAFSCCRAVVPEMKERKSGNLILISSTAGQRGEAFHSHYAASKGALISMTKSLAAELGPFGIRVNSVAPGWVDTDMSDEVLSDPELRAAIRSDIPLGRIARAEDIAGPILFLASDLSSHVTGEILNVNGGSVLCG